MGNRTFQIRLVRKNFTVITDHQNLISALSASDRSKTIQTRFTRWIDRLIPFNFDVTNLAGIESGLIEQTL